MVWSKYNFLWVKRPEPLSCCHFSVLDWNPKGLSFHMWKMGEKLARLLRLASWYIFQLGHSVTDQSSSYIYPTNLQGWVGQEEESLWWGSSHKELAHCLCVRGAQSQNQLHRQATGAKWFTQNDWGMAGFDKHPSLRQPSLSPSLHSQLL